MPTTRAVIFDIDDTLYAERDYVFSGYRAVADAFAGRIHAPFDLFERMSALFDSPDRARVFNIIVAEAGCENADALVAEMIATYRDHQPVIALDADAREVLTQLRGRVRLGAISDGYLGVQERKVTALGLADLLDEIVLTDTWGREFWKPHPRGFEEMARRLGVEHTACAYVADNLAKDFLAPNALGWTTVCVDRSERVHAGAIAPPGGAPAHIIGPLDELPHVLALVG